MKDIIRSFQNLSFQTKLLVIGGVLLFLSFISRKCCPCPEGFEDLRHVDSYLPNYVVEVQRRCLPGEQEQDGRYCVKKGCPSGMERGKGSGSELCYPKCLDKYDSNGMSRCYKSCPPGFKQEKTKCINPGHKFKKDTVPCKGCLGPAPVNDTDLGAFLPVFIEPPNAPVIMTPTSEAYPRTVVAHAHTGLQSHFHSAGLPWGMRQPPIWSKLFPTEYFEGAPGASPEEVLTKVTVNLREPRIDDPDLPCPRGYTLSGDLCHVNCPPHYRDTMDGQCTKPGYTIDRDSYDRGSGVPYITKRSKYDHVYHT